MGSCAYRRVQYWLAAFLADRIEFATACRASEHLKVTVGVAEGGDRMAADMRLDADRVAAKAETAYGARAQGALPTNL
jgi:hypothetical protein